VRDAASYLLWSLSRACPPKMLEPFTDKMATSLIAAAVYDREVGVRRAASAAYQEGVGRLVGLMSSGADIRGCTHKVSTCWGRRTSTPSALEGWLLPLLRLLLPCKCRWRMRLMVDIRCTELPCGNIYIISPFGIGTRLCEHWEHMR
jgi:hypothetical protein